MFVSMSKMEKIEKDSGARKSKTLIVVVAFSLTRGRSVVKALGYWGQLVV